MPYSYPSNLPTWAKNLPVGAQKIAVKVFNATLSKTSDEDKARIAAWSAIKQKYKEVGGKWVKKSFSVNLDGFADDTLPDDVKALPGHMPYVWKTIFNRLVAKDISVPTARDNAWKTVKRYVYQSGNGNWLMKKLVPPEKILGTVTTKRSTTMKMFVPGKNNGLFKITIPIDSKGLDVDEAGKKFLKGVASGSWVDREDDQIMSSFIKKMRETTKNLPVFVDHQRDSDHLIGHIADIESDDTVFAPITELEKEWSTDNELGNKQVTKLLERIPKVKFGYSIGGRFTKAVKCWDTNLRKYIRRIYDGEIYEVSVVPVPALSGTDVQIVTKNFDDKLFVKPDDNFSSFLKEYGIEDESAINVPDIKEIGMISDVGDVRDEDIFWMDFDKAVDKYVNLSINQSLWSEIDEDNLPDLCFINVSFDKSVRKYPYKYVGSDGKVQIHLQGLDIAYKNAKNDDNNTAITKLEEVRDSLGLGDRDYNFVDFRKLLVSTLSDAIDARDARYRLYDILDQYHATVSDIIWSDQTADDKATDLTALTNQLIKELHTLTDKMSKEVMVAVKSLSID